VLQLPHWPLLHLPQPLQSELVLQLPHLLLLHFPYLQSELVLQAPHWPPLHLLLGQSELVLQRLRSSCTSTVVPLFAADWLVTTSPTPNTMAAAITRVAMRFMISPSLVQLLGQEGSRKTRRNAMSVLFAAVRPPSTQFYAIVTPRTGRRRNG
jgi:hypothetical protein